MVKKNLAQRKILENKPTEYFFIRKNLTESFAKQKFRQKINKYNRELVS